jgi:hypothetical protein
VVKDKVVHWIEPLPEMEARESSAIQTLSLLEKKIVR